MKVEQMINRLTRPIICGLVISLASLPSYVFAQLTGFSTYEDPQGTFSIQYPADWEASPAENRFENVEVEFSKPNLGISQRMSVDVRILEDVGEELEIAGDLEEFLDLSVVQGSVTNQVPGFNVEEDIECGKYMIAGTEETCSVLYSFIDPAIGSRLATLQVAEVLGDDVYVASYTAPPNEFDTNLAQGEQIINSFRIMGGTGSGEVGNGNQDSGEATSEQENSEED